MDITDPHYIEAYNDDYPTCTRTDAVLRIYGHDLNPSEITQRLGLTPTSSQRRGDPLRHGRKRAPIGGWFLSSDRLVTSLDTRRHLDWLLDRIEPVAHVLAELRAEGYRLEIQCWWESAGATGGPVLNPTHLVRLAALGLPIGFDFN